jgi:hypothetical protein
MPDAQSLAPLRDIHLPPAIANWPWAPGWYVLASLLFLGVVGVVFFLWRRWYHGFTKRQALTLLAMYQRQHAQTLNASGISAQVSELLKRVALVYFPRENVAGLQGEDWITFLDSTASGVEFKQVYFELVELPYRSDAPMSDLAALFTMASRWIQQRGKPCLN